MINFKKQLSDHLLNLRGWNTRRRILVIESDDWGSIRMPSAEVFSKLMAAGIPVDKCPYNRFDSLESEADLHELFGTLAEIRNMEGRNPVITANCVVANPDFDQIRESGFNEYHYEPVTATFQQYHGCSGSFRMWGEGMARQLFYPQFHGREHLNVNRWMRALRNGLPETMLAFNYKLFGISTTITREVRKSYMAALDLDSMDELEDQKTIIREGLDLFEALLGYRSFTFIPTNYTWHTALEETMKEAGIAVLQGARVQRQPDINGTRIIRHYTGQVNAFKQVFSVRNASFEPATNPAKDWVRDCLNEISVSFFWNRPAIISTHRLNFTGSLVEENRTRNLLLFSELLRNIVKKWPEVEFMTSEELGRYMIEDMK